MNGARCTKYHEEPAPLPSVSMTLSSGRPSALAKAIASAAAWIAPAHRIWFVALVDCPKPVGPMCVMVRPSFSTTGLARSKTYGAPPHMIASVASRAPSTPPLTGQSRKAAPEGASRRAASRAVVAETVEQSMTVSPGRASPFSASMTDSTSASADTHTTITSETRASAAGSVATSQPVSAASAAAFAGVRFQQARSMPARCRLRAMCMPMAPSPMKLVFTIVPPAMRDRGCRRVQGRGPAAAARGIIASVPRRIHRAPARRREGAGEAGGSRERRRRSRRGSGARAGLVGLALRVQALGLELGLGQVDPLLVRAFAVQVVRADVVLVLLGRLLALLGPGVRDILGHGLAEARRRGLCGQGRRRHVAGRRRAGHRGGRDDDQQRAGRGRRLDRQQLAVARRRAVAVMDATLQV